MTARSAPDPRRGAGKPNIPTSLFMPTAPMPPSTPVLSPTVPMLPSTPELSSLTGSTAGHPPFALLSMLTAPADPSPNPRLPSPDLPTSTTIPAQLGVPLGCDPEELDSEKFTTTRLEKQVAIMGYAQASDSPPGTELDRCEVADTAERIAYEMCVAVAACPRRPVTKADESAAHDSVAPISDAYELAEVVCGLEAILRGVKSAAGSIIERLSASSPEHRLRTLQDASKIAGSDALLRVKLMRAELKILDDCMVNLQGSLHEAVSLEQSRIRSLKKSFFAGAAGMKFFNSDSASSQSTTQMAAEGDAQVRPAGQNPDAVTFKPGNTVWAGAYPPRPVEAGRSP